MLRIEKDKKQLIRVPQVALADGAYWEGHLEEMICANPDAFCEELGESLWLVGNQVRPSQSIADTIDILAIDDEGSAVIIELKRKTHKLQHLQAMSYAGMVSRWSAERFVETLAAKYKQSVEDARSAIEDHAGMNVESINKSQRVLLIAEDFDPALLMATEWLHEKFGVDIRCYRLQLSQENGSDYLTCTCIYPPLEIQSLSRGVGSAQEPRAHKWTDWPSALEVIENEAERAFFESELEAKQENRLSGRRLWYRVSNKRRFLVAARQDYAYVLQFGRFEADEEFWKANISQPTTVANKSGERRIRFRLVTKGDFAAFRHAMQAEMPSKAFSNVPDAETEDAAQEE